MMVDRGEVLPRPVAAWKPIDSLPLLPMMAITMPIIIQRTVRSGTLQAIE